MRLAIGLLAVLLVAPQSYPPAYPRTGATTLLENDDIVVWNIAWLKGHPSPLHRHVYDLTGVYYEPGDRMIIAVDGTKRPVQTKAGDIAFQRKGVTHIEEGTSDAPLRAVFIEFKRDAPSGRVDAAAGAPPFSAGDTPLVDNDRVTVWDYTAQARTPTRHRHARDTVVVWIDGRTAHAAFVPRGTVHDGESTGAASRVTVFELK